MAQQISYPIGDTLYLSITDRCTLQCTFCPKQNGSYRVRGYDLTMDHRPEVDEIIAAVGDPSRYREVVFCGYGEPTLRLKVLLEVAEAIKRQGGRVRVNTDGLGSLVNKRDIFPELKGRVDALSVSMNAQNSTIYERHCKPTLAHAFEEMCDFLARAPRFIPDTTATAIDGLEGVDIAACQALARQCGVRFRRRVLDQVG